MLRNSSHRQATIAPCFWRSFSSDRGSGYPARAAAAAAAVAAAAWVQVEQLFSYLTFIKNDLRSCLQPDHLNVNVCLRTYHTAHKYTLKGFPYMRAFVKWHGERKRRAADRTAADI